MDWSRVVDYLCIVSSYLDCHSDGTHSLQEDPFVNKLKLSFIVIPLHVGTCSGTKCRASQDHGAT